MQELIDAVRAWPVIVQGALGSALFSMALWLGQKITTYFSDYYATHSHRRKLSWLINEQAKCSANQSQSAHDFSIYASILTYRALRHALKALMWLSMGLICQSFFSLSGVVGFIGALYYLFKASEIIGPIDEKKYSKQRKFEVEREIKELQKA